MELIDIRIQSNQRVEQSNYLTTCDINMKLPNCEICDINTSPTTCDISMSLPTCDINTSLITCDINMKILNINGLIIIEYFSLILDTTSSNATFIYYAEHCHHPR